MAEPHLRLAFEYELDLLIGPKERLPEASGSCHALGSKRGSNCSLSSPCDYQRFAYWWNDRRLPELKRELGRV